MPGGLDGLGDCHQRRVGHRARNKSNLPINVLNISSNGMFSANPFPRREVINATDTKVMFVCQIIYTRTQIVKHDICLKMIPSTLNAPTDLSFTCTEGTARRVDYTTQGWTKKWSRVW